MTTHLHAPMHKLARIAMWTLVGIGAVAIVVVGLGAWGLTHAGYAVPDGDLPTHLAGRWDWTSAKEPCSASAHVIAFSDDRQTMTIAKLPTAADTGWTATYDILQLSSSRLRGAIRGETRRTDAGVPVVWDLVLFGPDEYHWQRTDWERWQYTPAVRRCGRSP